VFFPYPGTELHDLCREQGLLDSSFDKVLERRRPSMNLPGFSKRQISRRFTWSPLLFYGGHRPVKEVIWLVTMSKICSNRTTLTLWRAINDRYSPYHQFD